MFLLLSPMAGPLPTYSYTQHLYADTYYDPLPLPPAGPLAAHDHLLDWEHARISTLFVAGLPDDVKPREVHNLFCRRPGFESSLLEFTGKGNQVVAFVTFVTHHEAVGAMHTLNGAKFDPETGHTLFIELARSNSRKRAHEFGPYQVIDRRTKAKESNYETNLVSNIDGNTEHENENEYSESKKFPSNEQSAEIESTRSKVLPNSQQERIEGEIAPCTTLFIANVGPACTRDELHQVLSEYPGLRTLKMLRRGGMPVAFANFEDIESATTAMNGLQGTSLPSSDQSSMHLEYAKSKMRS